MATVKMGYYTLTIPEQIERTRLIVTMMTGNAYFTTPSPTMAVMSAAATALETAYNEARNRDKIKVAAMNARRKELLQLVLALASYVQQATEGDGEKILSSGFAIRAKGAPKPDTAGEVTNLRLSDGPASGSLVSKWDAASDAINYVVETATTADFSDSRYYAITTRTQKVLKVFKPGNTIWVRVRGLGKENVGNPSAAASILVR